MELFHRRYLCSFAFLFIFTAFLATMISGTAQIIAGLVAGGLAVCGLLAFFAYPKRKFAFSVCIVSLFLILVSLLNSFLFVTIPRAQAEQYVGTKKAVKLEIIGVESQSDKSSEYTVRIKQIEDKELNIKADLYCEFSSSFDYGDTLMSAVDIELPTNRNNDDKDKLLSLTVKDELPVLYKEEYQPDYFSFDGIRYICKNIRNSFGEYVNRIYGEESGALVRGFLINDKSDIPYSVKSDFSRSGISHLLAVSGLHIAILMGIIELLLRKLTVSKKTRCIIISIVAILFLGLTDFSASAVRSVLMLLAVYISYIFSEDGDSVTALFVSIAVIILISPFSVYDLGMWLSFFATLGLLTLYPFLEGKLPKPKSENKIIYLLQRFLLGISKTVLLTLVANIFILPIAWYFFGEISLSAIPANLLLSPVVAIYLPLCVITVVIGMIPLLNMVLVFASSALGNIILIVAEIFADVRGAVLSLRYPFVTPLMILFVIAFSVLMVIKLKQKMWLCLPPAIFCVAFAVGLTVFNLTSTAQVRYINVKSNDYIFIDKASEQTVCDVSSGGYSSYSDLFANINPYSTEIENYILTHCHKGHIYSVEKILTEMPVRTLYLPLSKNKQELLIAGEIYLLAKSYNAAVVFYNSGEVVQPLDNINVKTYFEAGERHSSVYVSVENENEILVYSDAAENQASITKAATSKYFVLGSHGDSFDTNAQVYFDSAAKVIFSTEARRAKSRIRLNGNKYYVIKPENHKIKLILPLE